MSNVFYTPSAVLGTLAEVSIQYKSLYKDENPNDIIAQWLDMCFAHTKFKVPEFAVKDYQMALNFLYSYRGSSDTFSAYRRDVERLLQWSWLVQNQSILNHKREDIEAFIEFCLKPPKRWIGLKKASRFKNIKDEKKPNPEWRLFEAHVIKEDHKEGIIPDKKNYQFSQQALKVMFGILSSFYNYLIQEEVTQANPIALMRQKSKFLQNQIKIQPIRCLSNQQWEMVLDYSKGKSN